MKNFTQRYQVPTDGSFRIGDFDPSDLGGFKNRRAAQSDLTQIHSRLVELQQLLYAQSEHAVLIVLQAMDTGGKDGAIRHVFGPLNPQGVQVAAFKVPSSLERAHDYLWRIHQQVPATGMIRVFNRSHYEDVLVVRVRGLAPLERVEQRYGQINDFEKYLSENNVTILKFFLHISRDEQRRRLQARLKDSTKHWKFSSADLAERSLWDEYQTAYETALARCSTPWAPWHIVPANRKWFRNLVIGAVVREALEKLKMTYPPAEPGLENIKIDR